MCRLPRDFSCQVLLEKPPSSLLPSPPSLTKLGDEHGHVPVVLGHRVVSRHCPRLLRLSVPRHELLVRAHEPWRARERAEHVLQLPEICGVENICAA